jgi:hypothetical protein
MKQKYLRKGSGITTPNEIYIVSKHIRADDTGLNDLIIAFSENTDLNDLIPPEAGGLKCAESFVKSITRLDEFSRNEIRIKKVLLAFKRASGKLEEDMRNDNKLNVNYKNDLTINTDLNDLVDMCTSSDSTALNELTTHGENHFYSNNGINNSFIIENYTYSHREAQTLRMKKRKRKIM